MALKLEGVPLVNTVGADVTASRVVIAAEDGKVAPDSVTTNHPAHHYKAGERVLVVLSALHPHDGTRKQRFGTPVGLSWNPVIKWILTEDGQAVWCGDSQPVDELIPAFEAADDSGDG